MRRLTAGAATLCWLALFACGCRQSGNQSSADGCFGSRALERTHRDLATLCAQGQAGLKDVARIAKRLKVAFHLGELENSCRAGNALCCERLAAIAESGSEDPGKAVTYYRLACQGRITHACTSFAQALLEGRGVARNVGSARQLFDWSCRRGDGRACFDLGVLYDTPRASTKDEARSAALFQNGCAAGETGACSRYGLMLAHGRGVPRDESRALTLLQRACHAGDADGCAGLEGKAVGYPRRLNIQESD
jgi:TPR repeat protein